MILTIYSLSLGIYQSNSLYNPNHIYSLMSFQDLLKHENSEPQNLKPIITKFLNDNSKNPKNSIQNKEKLRELIKNWSKDEQNQPQVTSLTLFLSDVEFADGQQHSAANALQMIKFNSNAINLSQSERIDIQLKICELFISGKDIYSAQEVYKDLKKIKDFNTILGGDKQTSQFYQMRYKFIDAQFLRQAGKYADAGQIYLSYIGNPRLQQYPEQRDTIIQSAIISMVISSQSPKRASLLANLYDNQLVKRHPLFQFVEKILFGNIISKQEALIINNRLAPYEQKINEDGVTPLQKAVFQHNIRCLPKLFSDISFKTLGELLGVSNNISFFTQLQQMIYGGFPAQIDQVSELVTFIPSKQNIISDEASEKKYNQRITNYCESLDRFLQKIRE